MSIISPSQRAIAVSRLTDFGLTVEFSTHASESDAFLSSSVTSRIVDIHAAFSDPNVKGIFTTIGGFNANQLLEYLDWDLIRSNPKMLCGFSDITILSNAIYAKTGLIGYSGPHFSTFGQKKGMDYTLSYAHKCLFEPTRFTIQPAAEWSDDEWYLDQENRQFTPTSGWTVIHDGKIKGKILGGNLNTLNLLQGTEYFPKLNRSILFIEDDDSTIDVLFDRDLQSLIQQPGFEKVRGLVIGRFQRKSEMTIDKLQKIIQTKKELENIPIMVDLDFGHTDPKFTFPIGGECKIDMNPSSPKLMILKH